jgi:Bacterial SH3 domain
MRQRSIRRAVRCTSFFTPLFLTLSLWFAANNALAAAIGDQVELKATHQAGVPFHNAPGGTKEFQRIPHGTRAQVVDVAKDGQWLKLSLPDGRTGWVSARYLGGTTAGAPSTGTSPTGKTPQRIEEGIVEHVADGDTLTVITPIQTKLCIRMFGLNTLHFRQHHYLFSAPAYRHEIRQQFQIFWEIKGLAPTA